MAVGAQGLRGARTTVGGVPAMLRRLGAVQLDTISVLARSHELVAYAAPGGHRAWPGRSSAYWGPKSSTFEYWSHAACVVPLEDWPAYGFTRRTRLAKGRRWHVLEDHERSCSEVLDRLRADGPLTANELGGAKKGGPWWDWSETKIAAEWLLDIGTLVCRERRGFQRVYDLAERAIPADLLSQEWTDQECAERLVAAAGASLGVATEADLATYHGLPRALVRRALPATGLVPVSRGGVEADRLRRPGRADDARDAGPRQERAPVAVRLAHLVPRARRAPVRPAPPPRGLHAEGEAHVRLLRDAGACRHHDRRAGRPRTAMVRSSWPSRSHCSATAPASAVARALVEAASWVGCTEVVVERMEPASARPDVENGVKALMRSR